MNTRPGFWIQTITGDPFDFDEVGLYHWNVEGIAHSLSQINRYVGHTVLPYSVAQHSVYIARWLLDQGYPARAAMHGLLHDAAEIAVGDISSPLKAFLKAQGCTQISELEHKIERSLFIEFGIEAKEFAEIVKEADCRISLDEKAQLLPPSKYQWAIEARGVTPLGIKISPVPHFAAKADFMALFQQLEEARQNES